MLWISSPHAVGSDRSNTQFEQVILNGIIYISVGRKRQSVNIDKFHISESISTIYHAVHFNVLLVVRYYVT